MTTPDPDPRRTPGIEPGGGVPPVRPHQPKGELTASRIRSPNCARNGVRIPLVLIMGVVALIAIGLIGMLVALIA
ncbi:DUF6480 family protein [Streptomyces avermitilis]|uniref:DUF6480 family protein n=1 Tax=Streptomyces avermitilis TaxID=33903 RepID=UPI00382DA481